MKELYMQNITQAVDECHDLELLDLVWKLLSDAAPTTPDPVEPVTLEVKCNANYSRDKRQHGPVTNQIRSSAWCSAPHHAVVGNRRAELPEVCGGADCLQSAA